jgi:predicted phosphoadenosine phosphosulfate sulfurtransferase
MASGIIDKDYVTVRVPKRIGTSGIRRIKEYIQFLENNGGVPKKVSQKTIDEISRKINKEAWNKLKKKRGLSLK